ncbi:DNA primase large subunit Spp2 [Coniothyrium glycines]
MAAPKQGGFKLALGGLKGKPGLKSMMPDKDVKRRRLALDDDEPEDNNKQQEIVGWDAAAGGALDVGGNKKEDGPRIIPVQPSRDWRVEARRKQLAKAPHTQEQNAEIPVAEMEGPEISYGLTYVEKKDVPINGEQEAAPEPMDVDEDNLTDEQRLERKALEALINGKSADDDLVIPVVSEDEALHRDLDDAPDAPTLEAYEAQPIEGFGAALLRGMGWKDGEGLGKNGKVAPNKVKRRSALLGIGAKEEAAVGIELGTWGNKGKGKKIAQTYNPVALRNRKTGEIITEEELKAKLENQDLVQDEKPPKDRSKYDDEEDDRRREKRRERRDDRDRDRRREEDHDSERKQIKDRDRRDDRRRDRDDYSDSDRRRDRRRDKHRDEDYDSERRRDKRKARSRSPDDRRERKHDRHRSRSRDAEGRRDRTKDRDRRERSRSRDSEERRRRRKEREYDDRTGGRRRR